MPSSQFSYEKGVVCEKNLKKITVKMLNGKKQVYNLRKFDAVVWNVEPKPTDLRIGSLVISSDEEHGREQVMILGRIREIKTNLRKRTTYLVDRFDETSIITTLSKIRVVPEGDQTGTSQS